MLACCPLSVSESGAPSESRISAAAVHSSPSPLWWRAVIGGGVGVGVWGGGVMLRYCDREQMRCALTAAPLCHRWMANVRRQTARAGATKRRKPVLSDGI